MNLKNYLKNKNQTKKLRFLVILAIVLHLPIASAGSVIKSRVVLEDDHYLIYVVMDVDAEYKKVYAHLTNYDQLHLLSKSITGSELLDAAHPEYVVRVSTYSCIGVFCQEVVQLQNVTELSQGYIKVSVVAAESDLDYSENLWHIQPYKNGTRVSYSSDMVPGFWVPPLIGTLLFKDKLLEETYAIINGLESLAK